MTNSQKIIQFIDSFYKKPKDHYDVLVANHARVIDNLSEFWNDLFIDQPSEGQPVLAIQDMTSIGKGAFVGKYFFQDGVFVANMGDDDPYGFITLWVGTDTLNALPTNPVNMEMYL